MNYRGLKIEPMSFGAVTTDDLFCDKEQAIFDFYERKRYRKAVDIGANVGVHTMLMLQQGWKVKAFEPDPLHFNALVHNLLANGLMDETVDLYRAAMSDHDGMGEFVRVCGNTTGSHLKGDKTPYGPLQTFKVQVMDCRPFFEEADFVKMDCEGHEARLLLTVTPETRCEFMVEVGSRKNAELIYRHFERLPVWLWAQKNGWGPVNDLEDMPVHHSDGALFIGERP